VTPDPEGPTPMSRSYDDRHDAIERIVRDGILQRAMEPGGVDAWARIDRKVPGDHHGWVIVPQDHDSYSPGAMTVRDDTIIKAIERLQGGWTLDELKCTAEFIDQVDTVLAPGGAGGIYDFEPAIAAQIVQIGLFGSIWYR
jgi:hypothetical protein